MRVLAFLLCAFVFTFSFAAQQAAASEWLVNGDFEDTSGTFPSGWEIVNGEVAQTTGFDGTATAVAFLPSPWGGRITQTDIDVAADWQCDLMLATSNPGGSTDRSINMLLGDAFSGHINMRVNGDGNLQAFDGSAWQDLISGGIVFSQDNTYDGDFDDPGEVLNVQRVRIIGDYDAGGGPVYEALLTAPGSTEYTMTSGSVSYFNYGVPASTRGIDMLTIKSDSSQGGFVVDQVSVTGEEAPAAPSFPGLVNGDFEDTTAPFPAGWTIEAGAPVEHAGLDGSGTSLLLRKSAAGGDRIYQEYVETDTEWDLDFYFASEQPANAGDRALNFMASTVAGTLLNLRVEQSGALQAHNGSAWVDLITDAITFSTDGNADGDFSDPEDTLNVHHIKISGQPDDDAFAVDISAANEEEFSLNCLSTEWANASFASRGLTKLTFSATSSTCTGSSVIDNIVITDGTNVEVPNIAGDANGDGKVDGSDVTILAGNWQAGVGAPDPLTITWGMGDFNGDGQVDGSDVTILAGNWQYGVTAAAASVPEPSTLVLLLGSIVFLMLRRRIR